MAESLALYDKANAVQKKAECIITDGYVNSLEAIRVKPVYQSFKAESKDEIN